MTVLSESGDYYNRVITVAVIFIFLAFMIWFLVDVYRLNKFDGNVKRGVKIWSRELSNETWQYLLNLKTDKVTMQDSSEMPLEFIKVYPNGLLIYSSPQRFWSSWDCIGFVDPESPVAELEYRMSLPGLIFLLLFAVIGWLMFVISFAYYKKAIDSFIERSVSISLSNAENS